MHRGSCLCGAVRFTVEGELRGPDACHCNTCRKHSGHFFVSTDVPRSAVTIEGQDKIGWFQSSNKARRGFCSVCGASLFWDPLQRDWIGIAMGAFDTPTRTRLALHVYVAEKGDYYDVADGAPQFDTIPPKPQ
ncbi:GFA family protein [Myxococcus sp. Y35]|uniref:GFA family protein n=1 Tax=Pseudomyxococcus flavus TaxID=3115648 RepID=UPI003CFA0907